MTKADIQRLAQEYQQKELDEWEDAHIAGSLREEEERDAISSILADRLEEAESQLTWADYSKVSRTAESLLREHKESLPTDSPEFRRLCHELLLAEQTVLRTELDRLYGRWAPKAVPTGISPTGKEAPSIPIGQAVKLYFEHYHNRDKRTNEEKLVVVRRFIETLPLGDATPLNRVKKPETIAFRDAYGKLPARVLKQHRGLPIIDLLKKLNGTAYTRVTKSTVNHALTDLRHFFSWAMKHDHYLEAKNPVDGIDHEGVTEEHSAPYTEADLSKLFSAPDYLKQKIEYPARYWLPMVLLYTGARREEIAQLTPSDIGQDADIYYFNITNDPETGKRVKNAASQRRVPIHSRLIELGLLDYWKLHHKKPLLFFKQKSRGTRSAPGRRTCGDSVSKWFATLKKKLGITGKKTIHSFRSTVVTRLFSAGCPEDIRKVLVGHAAEDVHGQVYIHREGIPLTVLKEHLEKLRFPI